MQKQTWSYDPLRGKVAAKKVKPLNPPFVSNSREAVDDMPEPVATTSPTSPAFSALSLLSDLPKLRFGLVDFKDCRKCRKTHRCI